MTSYRAAPLAAACLLALLTSAPVSAQAPAPQAAPPQATPPQATPPAPPRARGAATPAAATPATATPAPAPRGPILPLQPGGMIQAVQVVGNERIEADTIRSYMLVAPGDPFDPDRIDRSLKTLYATGLFQDVTLTRQGNTLVVKVVENPVVNVVAFEGNHKLNDTQLREAIQLRPRAVFTPALAEADRKAILDRYAKAARYDASVVPKLIRLPQNRVNVVFEINEGEPTLVSRIAIVGNRAFSEGRLEEVINSREQAWWRFLSSSDVYDPERVNYDKELLRRFYLKNGYADFEVKDATAELSPDRRSFFLTYTISEGERYKLAKVDVTSSLRHVPADSLKKDIDIQAGDWYDGDAVNRIADKMTEDVQNRGFAFVDVKPRITRNTKDHTIDLTFEVGEGPRVYIERIDISGNTRTEDKVIRREFRVAEGDAFNAEAIRTSRQRLNDLGFFNSVNIQPSPGSAPDKAILNTRVEEKATGQLSVGGGYSTDVGFLINVGLSEKNLLGTGIAASIDGVLAQKRSSIDLNVTDPYFLDRNLVAGTDIFYLNNDYQNIAQYDEQRIGFANTLGYAFNEHLRQSWTYSLVQRNVYDVQDTASLYIQDEAGRTLLSQLGQVITLDYRDSRVDPHSGYVVRLGTDFAGIGGDAHFFRTKIDGSYFIPLDRFTGNSDWGIQVSAGTGYLFNLGHQENIIDRFFLGGDNLRGFETGGAGPHDPSTGDALGGRFIWTQSTELHFPLPISPDLGLSGRTFVDVGGLTQANFESGVCPAATNGVCPTIAASSAPRLGAGVGVSWRTPFGLINIDVTPFVVKQPYDQTQVFRFGFGTRF